MTNVKCGSTINAPLSQITSMKIYKIQIVHGFAQNVTSSTFRIHSYLEEQKRFAPLSIDSSCGTKTCESGTNKNKFISGLKFSSVNINSIRGKKLELLAFLA